MSETVKKPKAKPKSKESHHTHKKLEHLQAVAELLPRPITAGASPVGTGNKFMPAPKPENLDEYIHRCTRQGKATKFASPDELRDAIAKYFSEIIAPVIDKDGTVISYAFTQMPTLTGVSIAIGLSRQGLRDYEVRGENRPNSSFDVECSKIVKATRDVIESFYEQALLEPDRRNVSGVIFALKNGFGWKDERETRTEIVNKYEQVKSPDEIKQLISADLPTDDYR